MDINVTVDVDKIDLNEIIGSHYDEDGDRVPAGNLADLVAHQLVLKMAKSDVYNNLVERVRTIRDEEIRAHLAPTIAEALNAPLKRTNTYGEPTGTETTLRDLVMDEAKKYLGEIDRHASRMNNSVTRLQVALKEAVDAAFKAEIADAVKAVREDVKTRFGQSVGELVSGAVREAMNARI